MTTYVDDCDLDAAKPLRALIWKVVRTQPAAKDKVHVQKFLGVVREAWAGTSWCRGQRLTHSDHTAKILEGAVKLGFGPIRVCTTAGQSVAPPPASTAVRSWSARDHWTCHAAHVSISPLLSHGSQDLSHAGASGLEKK